MEERTAIRLGHACHGCARARARARGMILDRDDEQVGRWAMSRDREPCKRAVVVVVIGRQVLPKVLDLHARWRERPQSRSPNERQPRGFFEAATYSLEDAEMTPARCYSALYAIEALCLAAYSPLNKSKQRPQAATGPTKPTCLAPASVICSASLVLVATTTTTRRWRRRQRRSLTAYIVRERIGVSRRPRHKDTEDDDTADAQSEEEMEPS